MSTKLIYLPVDHMDSPVSCNTNLKSSSSNSSSKEDAYNENNEHRTAKIKLTSPKPYSHINQKPSKKEIVSKYYEFSSSPKSDNAAKIVAGNLRNGSTRAICLTLQVLGSSLDFIIDCISSDLVHNVIGVMFTACIEIFIVTVLAISTVLAEMILSIEESYNRHRSLTKASVEKDETNFEDYVQESDADQEHECYKRKELEASNKEVSGEDLSKINMEEVNLLKPNDNKNNENFLNTREEFQTQSDRRFFENQEKQQSDLATSSNPDSSITDTSKSTNPETIIINNLEADLLVKKEENISRIGFLEKNLRNCDDSYTLK